MQPITLLEDIAIDGVRLHMRAGWYQNFPRRDHRIRHTEHGTVSMRMTSALMEKIVGLRVESSFIVTRLTPEQLKAHKLERFQDQQIVFPWGSALVLDGSLFQSGGSDYRIFILPHRLFIHASSYDFLKEIDRISSDEQLAEERLSQT